MIFALSVFLGLLSVVNKVLLFLEKKSGWMSGIVIGLTSGFYFWAIDLKILAVAEFGFFIVMLYGYIKQTRPSLRVTFWINLVLTALSIFLCYFFFAGVLTIFETISALSFIWGGYQLAIDKKVFGWLLFLSAHVTLSTNAFYAEQTIFAWLQVVSALVCIYAIFISLLRRSKRAV